MKTLNTQTSEMNPAKATDSFAPAPERQTKTKGDVVVSLNGRDEGKRFFVVGTEDEYSLIADGKGRRIEKPKRKKNKHLKLEDKTDNNVAAKLIEDEKVTNNEIRRALAEYAEARGEKGGM